MDKTFDINNDYTFEIKENDNVFLHVTSSSNIKCRIIDTTCNIFIFFDFNNKSSINEEYEIINSNVHMYYCDLNNIDFNFNSNISLHKKSELIINNILLASLNKQLQFNVSNVEDHANCEIYNSVVSLKDSDFSLKIIGNILKKSPYSRCIQKTHCISVGNPKKLSVLPILNIDNENVEAAHSLSSGTIDANILYYLNTRGINKDDALKLIVKSYLTLSNDALNDFSFANIADIYNRKVSSLCLI